MHALETLAGNAPLFLQQLEHSPHPPPAADHADVGCRPAQHLQQRRDIVLVAARDQDDVSILVQRKVAQRRLERRGDDPVGHGEAFLAGKAGPIVEHDDAKVAHFAQLGQRQGSVPCTDDEQRRRAVLHFDEELRAAVLRLHV